jgi:PAS domain S-box-containing protein
MTERETSTRGTPPIARRNTPSKDQLLRENERLRAELAEVQETLRAIQSGGVDAVVVNGPAGEQLFTLRGAEYAYRKDGQILSLLISSGKVAGQSGVVGRVLTLNDIPEQKQAEVKLQKLNRTLKATSNSNQALLHAQTEEELLQKVCKIITEGCGHAMVWIGYAEDDENKTVRPMAHAGFEEGYLETLRITWAETERGCGPTGIAIRTCQPCVCRDMRTDPRFEPWRDEAIRRGYASSVALPLAKDGKVFGVITIYNREPDAFFEDEVKLLMDLAADLAYGISTFRIRAARERAEAGLRQSEARFRAFFETAAAGAAELDTSQRFVQVNHQFCEITGYSREELLGMKVADLTHPVDFERDQEQLVSYLRGGAPLYEAEKRYVRKDGNVLWVQVTAAMVRDAEGKLLLSAGIIQDITERKRAEQALRLSEEKFAKAFAGNPAAIALTRLEDGLFLDVNDTWLVLNGYSREEAIGQSVKKMNIWPTHEARARFVKELREKASLRGVQQEFLKKSGEVFVAELSAQILVINDEQLVLSTMVDITGRKRAEEELRASEERLRAFLNNSAVIAWLKDEDGRHVFLSDRYQSRFQAGFNEWKGKTDFELWPKEVAEQFRRNDQEVLAADRTTEVIEESVNPDGSHSWWLSSKFSFRERSGKRYVGGLAVDITERKRVEEALRESEAKFRALFESSPDAVFLTIPDGRVLAANSAACAMFGMSEAEICRVGRQGLADPDDRRFAAAEEERLRTGRLTKTELNFVRANGERFPTEVDSVILSGSSTHAFVIMRDISGRKRAERALIHSEKLASVGRMAATIAHEINNPLETIGHAIYLASTDPVTSPEAKSYLEMATQQLERVAHITKQTLDFHRESTTPAQIDLRESLDGIVKLFANRLQSRGIAVQKSYANVKRVLAVGEEIQQIISNLLNNSMDALPNGGKIYLHVSRTIRAAGSPGVRLTIADTGLGIAPECQKRIFEPFFTTKEIMGTGLGLWITKQIVDKHGATIRVRSKAAKGTVISIVFPTRTPK